MRAPEGAAAGTVVIDMSSISPLVSQKVGAACEAKGVEFLDAPVSGGEPKAIDGTLAIMVGGKAESFAKVEAILAKMGSSVTLTGPVGAGNVEDDLWRLTVLLIDGGKGAEELAGDVGEDGGLASGDFLLRKQE